MQGCITGRFYSSPLFAERRLASVVGYCSVAKFRTLVILSALKVGAFVAESALLRQPEVSLRRQLLCVTACHIRTRRNFGWGCFIVGPLCHVYGARCSLTWPKRHSYSKCWRACVPLLCLVAS